MRDWDFDGQLARTLRIVACLLVFFCLSLLIRPQDQVLWGLGIGIATGMWNAFFLGKRLRNIVSMVVPSAYAHMKAGYAMRISISIAVLYLVSRTDSINLYAAAAGIFVAPCVFTFSTVLMLMGLPNGKPERPNP
ncbi:MAG: ATP synthase subunit I [Desulfotomaculaceae bacterium]|nr:ATP synthase subunit I [Desulfotomaculaceae bacterium]